MDNKITKKRLGDFLSYEWLVIVAIAVCAIMVFQFIFNLTSVKLTKGQQFVISYDESVLKGNEGELVTLMAERKTFSYDVCEVNVSSLESSSQHDLLNVRYNTQDVDILITDNLERTDSETGVKITRAKTIMDSYMVWSFEDMITQSCTYLKRFLKSGIDYSQDNRVVLDFDNLDLSKIDAYFNERQKGDNRFRSDEEKAKGRLAERERIEKLCLDVKKVDYLLNEYPLLFMRYTPYEQAVEMYPDDKQLQEAHSSFTEKSYGLNIEKMTSFSGQGKKNVSDFFQINGTGTTKGLVAICFELTEYQRDLQYEQISFMIGLVEIFTPCLDNFTA